MDPSVSSCDESSNTGVEGDECFLYHENITGFNTCMFIVLQVMIRAGCSGKKDET